MWNSVWNLENLLQKRTICTISSGLKGLKREGKILEMISAPGCPSTSKTDANIEKVGEIVRQNHCLSIQAVAELINTDKETVRQIFFSTSEGSFTWIGCLKVRPFNQVFYKEVLTNLRERVRRRRPEMWKNGSCVLHQDNAPAHNALSVKTFLTKHKITVLEHPLH